MSDKERADDIILEVQRLWPPFFGGRRVCIEVRSFSMLSPIIMVIFPTWSTWGRMHTECKHSS